MNILAGTIPISYESIRVPEEFGPLLVEHRREDVEKFAFAVADYSDWYLGASSPFGRPIAPPLFLGNSLLFLPFTKYDINSSRGLHTHERLSFYSPLMRGETATVTGGYRDRFVRRGQGCAVLDSKAWGEDGRLLVHHRSVEVIEAAIGAVAGRSSAPQPRDRFVSGETTATPPVSTAVRGIPARTPIAPTEKRISEDQVKVFSWADSGVKNAHTDTSVARAAGLDQLIVQAMQQTAYISEWAVSFFGAPFFTSGELDLRFVSPAWPGDLLTVEGCVLGEIETRAGIGLEVEVWVRRPDGTRTVLGWASAAFDSSLPQSTEP